MSNNLPILYSFRRCPYAMRARMGLFYSGVTCELREVDLKNKPQELLDISPKATVPVLVLTDGSLIDESIDIIYYALSQNDPDNWLCEAQELTKLNDNIFTALLRKYKYFERYPEKTQIEYRQETEEKYIKLLENKLEKNSFLAGNNISMADIALFPFVRQYAFVDENWFFSAPYPLLQKWLKTFLEHPVFEGIMQKHKPWQNGDSPIYFGRDNA